MRNVQGHNGVCNSININTSNVLASGLDNGILELYDWNTGYKFQSIASPPQSGSLDSEAGILGTSYIHSFFRFSILVILLLLILIIALLTFINGLYFISYYLYPSPLYVSSGSI